MGFGYSDIPSNGITDSFSLSFDGTGDYAGSNLATAYSGWKPAYIHANATTAFWIKMRDFSGNQLFGCHNDKRWYMGFNNARAAIGVQDANNIGSPITITPTPTVGEWLHYTVVANGGTATVYINGIAQGTMAYTQSSGNNATGFIIAATYNPVGSPEYGINGSISDLATYTVALTPEQVKTIYNGREPFDHNDWAMTNKLDTWYRLGDAKKGFIDEAICIDSATLSSIRGRRGATGAVVDTGNDILLNAGVTWVFGWTRVDFVHSGGNNTCTTDGAEQSFAPSFAVCDDNTLDGGVIKIEYKIIANTAPVTFKCGGKTNNICAETTLTSSVGVHTQWIECVGDGNADGITFFHADGSTGETFTIDYMKVYHYPNGKLLKNDAGFSEDGPG